jgi:hypothetical protein
MQQPDPTNDDHRDIQQYLAETHQILRALMELQLVQLDQVESLLQLNPRDEIRMALAGQSRRLRMILAEVQAKVMIDGPQTPTREIHLAIARSHHAITSLLNGLGQPQPSGDVQEQRPSG